MTYATVSMAEKIEPNAISPPVGAPTLGSGKKFIVVEQLRDG
jgi:hypothetical protein